MFKEAEEACKAAYATFKAAEDAYRAARYTYRAARDAYNVAWDAYKAAVDEEAREAAWEAYKEAVEACKAAWEAFKDAEAAYKAAEEAFEEAFEDAEDSIVALEAARDAENKSAWVEVPDNSIECVCGCKNDIQFADFGSGIVDLIIHGKKGVLCVELDAPNLTALKALIEKALDDVESK